MTTTQEKICFRCKGYGVVEQEQGYYVTCHECRGSGLLNAPVIQAQVDVSSIPKPNDDCPVCNGNGVVFVGSTVPGDDGSRMCPCCNGSGVYPSPAEIIKLREELNQFLTLREVQSKALLDNMVNVLSTMFITEEGVKL